MSIWVSSGVVPVNENTPMTTAAVSSNDVDKARAFTRGRVFEITKGLTQAKFKPAPDVWSIAEIVDHLAVVHERVLGQIRVGLVERARRSAR